MNKAMGEETEQGTAPDGIRELVGLISAFCLYRVGMKPEVFDISHRQDEEMNSIVTISFNAREISDQDVAMVRKTINSVKLQTRRSGEALVEIAIRASGGVQDESTLVKN